MTSKTKRAPRLDRDSRREQLLETARALLADTGFSAFTMEGLAQAAGVNKALPYRHFDNADAVLNEIYREVSLEIGTRVLDATRGVEAVDDRIRAAVGAYLDAVFDNTDLLKILAGPISPRSAFDDPRVGIDFAANLLVRRFELSEERAWASASILQGALSGGVGALMNEEATRSQVDEVLVTMIRALVHDNADAPS